MPKKNSPLYVFTDLFDYAPGDTAVFTVEGVDKGGSIEFEVQHVSDPGEDGVYGTADDVTVDLGGDGHDAWVVVDGGEGDLDGKANGTIVTEWYVNPDDSLDETFLLTATDLSSGEVASTSFTDSLPGDASADLTFANSEEVSGALFSTADGAAGTGLLDPFVRISTNKDVEEGYNTSGRKLEFDENSSPNFTRDLQFGDIPVVTVQIDGEWVQALEFQLDINEPKDGSSEYLSLDVIEIYATNSAISNPKAGGYAFLTSDPNYLVWELDDDSTPEDEWIALNYALQEGSGVSDMIMYVPLKYFEDADVSEDDYITLYSKFGVQPTESDGTTTYEWINNSGFEEWAVREFATIDGVKFHDLDGDGAARETGEPALDEWEIRAYIDLNEDGNLDTDEYNVGAVAVDFTDGEDGYSIDLFPDAVRPDNQEIVEDAQYLIVEVLKDGFDQTYPGGSLILDASLNSGSEEFGQYGYVVNGSDDIEDADFGNFEPAPGITVTKTVTDVGGDGADGVADEVGDIITYGIAVANTGNVVLTYSSVTDSVEGYSTTVVGVTGGDTYNIGDTSNKGFLDLTETWLYTTTYTVTQADLNANGYDDADGDCDGTIDNTATAVFLYGAAPVTDSDTQSVDILYDPDIKIVKEVSVDGGTTWDDANTSQGPTAYGDEVSFRFTVTNEGNIDLTDVVVTDPDYDLNGDDSGAAWNIGNLAVGGEEVLTITVDVPADDDDPANDVQMNTATVVADAECEEDRDIGDSDVAYYFNADPRIHIEKYTNGIDADDPTGPHIAVGGLVTWTYIVTNTGNVDLDNVVVEDDLEGLILTRDADLSGNNDDFLEVGEIWSYTHTGTAEAGQYANIATVTADDAADNEVSDTDPSHYFGDLPPPTDPDGSAMTPGFWKTHLDIFNHELFQYDQETGLPYGDPLIDSMTMPPPDPADEDLASNRSYEEVFGVTLLDGAIGFTLDDALGAMGGHELALVRSSTAALANAASEELNYIVDEDSFEYGIAEVFGLDPVLDAGEINTLRAQYISFAEDIDYDDNGEIIVDEVIKAVQDVYGDIGADDEFSLSDLDDVAKTFDILNNMPHIGAEEFA